MHWRGQTQGEMPYMDGAPLITQCPILSYSTFQYKFRASVPGTHLWHAHAGNSHESYHSVIKVSIVCAGRIVFFSKENKEQMKDLSINGRPYSLSIKECKRNNQLNKRAKQLLCWKEEIFTSFCLQIFSIDNNCLI